MIGFIVSVLDLFVSLVILYVVLMTNQKKVIDIPDNLQKAGGSGLSMPLEGASDSNSGGEDQAGSNLMPRGGLRSLRISPGNLLTGRFSRLRSTPPSSGLQNKN